MSIVRYTSNGQFMYIAVQQTSVLLILHMIYHYLTNGIF